MELNQWIVEMPKAELHVHLEGSIHPETVLRLAERHQMVNRLPAHDVDGLREWYHFSDFRHFLNVYLTIQDLIRDEADFALIAYQFGADMAEQGIIYREATVTPYTHTDLQDKGLSIDALIAGLERGRQRARDEFGVEIRWIFDIPRNVSFMKAPGVYDPIPAEKTLEYAVRGMPFGVIGLGLGGDEVNAPSKPFAHAFDQTSAAGLFSLPHAGEVAGAESVWSALKDLHADRIGHGVRSIEDEKLVAYLAETQTPLEVNITSNLCLGVYPDLASHPFRRLDEMGVFVTVNSDDPPLFNTRLVDEYNLLTAGLGYDRAGVMRIARNAFLASKADDETKRRMLEQFDRWAEKQK
ncbi:MAG: adenosine deaminase [Anaerolineaceae bacterium]|nr:adenosine deaminase [Anaerolineaceae bacterium]